MEDVEIWEVHYGQGGLNYRHGIQRLLQHLHQGSKSIDGPLDDTRGTQGGTRKDKPQVLKGEDHLDHCAPKEKNNAGGIRNLQQNPKVGQ